MMKAGNSMAVLCVTQNSNMAGKQSMQRQRIHVAMSNGCVLPAACTCAASLAKQSSASPAFCMAACKNISKKDTW
jgi:hypothetical protein